MINWWHGLNDRERHLVSIGAPILLFALLYWGIWTPFSNYVQEVEDQLQTQRNTLAWMQKKGGEIKALQASGGNRVDLNMTLEGVVNLTSRQMGLTLTRLQPINNQLQVETADIEFDRLVNWLVTMERDYGVRVKLIELAAGEQHTGVVKLRRLQVGRD